MSDIAKRSTSSAPSLLVLGLPEQSSDWPIEATAWFERMVDPDQRAAIASSAPLPFDEVSWPGGNVMLLRTSWSQGHRPVEDWQEVRRALSRFLEELHAREPIAFLAGPDTFSIAEGGAELAARVIPPVLAYFESTPAARSPKNDPGVRLLEACFQPILEEFEAGRATPLHHAWHHLLTPALGRNFRLDSRLLANLSRVLEQAPDVDPRLSLASFRQWPSGADGLGPMRAVLDARSVSARWFGEMLRELRDWANVNALQALSAGVPIATVDASRRRQAFDVVRRYRELGEPFDTSWLRHARDLARQTGYWDDEVDITRDLLGILTGFEAQRVRGDLLEEALRRRDERVIAEQTEHVIERAQSIAAGAEGAEALEALLATPVLRELVRVEARDTAVEVAAAYVTNPGTVLETDETLSLVLRALSFDPRRRALEDRVAEGIAKRFAAHQRLKTTPPKQPPLFGPPAVQLAMKMYLATAAPKISNVLPLSLSAWHARRGRHNEAAASAAIALEWGNEGVRTDPDLAVARTLEPLLGALRTTERS